MAAAAAAPEPSAAAVVGAAGGIGGGGVDGGGGAGGGCGQRSAVWYRCRKCRTPIFSAAMLEPHAEGEGQTAFKWGRRESNTIYVI